jgi:hypothetical protein
MIGEYRKELLDVVRDLGLTPRKAFDMDVLDTHEYVQVSNHLAAKASAIPWTDRLEEIVDDAAKAYEREDWEYLSVCSGALFTLVAEDESVPDAHVMVTRAYFRATCRRIGGKLGLELESAL